MRISAINVNNYHVANKKHSNNANFKGLIIKKDSYGNEWNYQGNISGSSFDGHYQGSDITEEQVYHPFKDETKAHIEKELDENNFTTESIGTGYAFITTYKTTLGKTIPFTEREWNNLPDTLKEKFKAML